MTIRTIIFLILICCCCVAVPAQSGKKAMTVDDVLAMATPAGAEVSPDGRWVVFSKSTLDWEHNKRPMNLWMVSTAGGHPFQFTSVDGDSSPQWSPDSGSVAFLRNPAGNGGAGESRDQDDAGRQVWVIPMAGGEAIQFTNHKGGINAFRWSADGKSIFFVANEALSDAEKKAMKNGDDAIFVDEGPNGQGRGEWSHLWMFNVGDKKEREITKDKLIISSFDPSPDGNSIAFTARTENARNAEYLSEIYIADVATGTTIRLTDNQAPESSVRWSPDGKRLAYLAPDDKEWKLANSKLWVIDVSTKAYSKRSGSFEGAIGYYSWSEDGKSVLFSAQQRTSANIYRLDLESGAVKKLTNLPGVLSTNSFSKDGRIAAAIYSTPETPSDVWSIDLGLDTSKQLTDLNPWLKEKALAKAEVITWKSSDGLPIEGILYLPADYAPGTKIPLILTVHGGPAGSFSFGFGGIYDVYAGLGYAVLCPNVRGSSAYTDALLNGNSRDLGGGDYHDLMTGVDAVIARGIADPDHLGIRGWSYGGILSGWTITQTHRFKAASLGAMVTDWASEYAMGFNFDISRWYIGGTPWDNPEGYRKESSYSFIKNVTTPSIIFHGERDTTDTIGQSMIYYQGLKDRGVPVRFIRFPGEPHGFRQPHHQRLRDVQEIAWMQKYVRGIDWKDERPAEKSKSTSGSEPAETPRQ